jgi:ribosomal-protein-alanine N-acetyltransferase
VATAWTIETARLRLRPACAGDAAVLQALWSRPLVRRFLWDDRVVTLEEARDVLATNDALFAERGVGLWLAHPLDEDVVMGFAGYWLFHEPPCLELLYGLDDRWWGRGLATEAAAALVRFGREQRGFGAIQASIDTPNVASARVLERLGFEPMDPVPRAKPNTSFFRLVGEIGAGARG